MTNSKHKTTGQYARKIELGHDYQEAKRNTTLPTYTAEELSTEVWAPVTADTPIPLEASNLGRIRLTEDRKVLPVGVSHSGYLIVSLPIRCHPRTLAVAPLVYSAWHPNTPLCRAVRRDEDKPRMCVAFRDGDHTNTRPDNLVPMPFLRACHRTASKCTPILVDGYVYPGAVEVAKVYAVTPPTVVRWIARNRTRWGNPIRYAPEYAHSMDGMTVRL